VDLSSYAELAVRLVNTSDPGQPKRDDLRDLEALGVLVADRPHLNVRANRNDLDALRLLRAELRKIFSAAANGDGADAVEMLNALLIQHPIHPQISGHDGQRWHLHLTESGSVADKYAAGAVMGLAVLATEIGIDRLGICQAASCEAAFLDTTTNRSRRYCSDRCASRSNVAAYRARKQRGDDERGQDDGPAAVAPG
jgi:predicted RNA-binding Zn ribbon-like protein